MAISCHRIASTDKSLEDIETLMYSYPDSAYESLKRYDRINLHTKRDFALYRLLLAEGRYKTYHPDTVDIALTDAAEYFKSADENVRAVRTLFCKAEIYRENGEIGKGICVSEEALSLIDTVAEPFQAGRLHYQISELYNAVWNGPQQLFHAEKAMDYFMKADTLDFLTDARLWYGNSLSQMNRNKEGVNILEQLLEEVSGNNDTVAVCQVLSYLGNAYMWERDYRNGYSAFRRLQILQADQMEKRDMQLLLWSAIESKVPDKEIEAIADLLRLYYGGDSLIEEYFVRKGDYRNAYTLLKNETEELNDTYVNLLRDTSREYVVMSHQDKLNAADARVSSMKIIIILTIIIGVISLVLLIVFALFYIQKKNNRIEKLLGRVSRTVSVAKEMRTQRNLLRQERDGIIEENKRLSAHSSPATVSDFLHSLIDVLNSHYEAYYSNQEEKGVLLKNMREKIDILREDKDLLNQMEEIINNDTAGLLEDVFESLKRFGDPQRRLVCFLYLGLSTEAICAIFDITPTNYYNRKSRLMTKLHTSLSKRRNELIELLKN
jgi:tetratricopeptide (TPR) repeat protein